MQANFSHKMIDVLAWSEQAALVLRNGNPDQPAYHQHDAMISRWGAKAVERKKDELRRRGYLSTGYGLTEKGKAALAAARAAQTV